MSSLSSMVRGWRRFSGLRHVAIRPAGLGLDSLQPRLARLEQALEAERRRNAGLQRRLDDRAAGVVALSREISASAGGALAFAQVLGDARMAGPLGLRQARALEHVLIHARRLSALAEDLDDQAQDAAGRIPLKLERLDPQHALSDALAVHAGRAAEAGVQLIVPERASGLAVLSDAAQLSTAVRDMVGTAVDLAGRAALAGGAVVVELRREGAVELTVQAIGAPVTGEDLKRMQGPGQPLHLLRRRARRLGAELSVGLLREIGVRFALALPGLGEGSVAASPLAAARPLRGRVLHVSPQAPERALLRLVTGASEEVRLHGADTAEDGLRMARELMPDLILLDLAMPGAEALCAALAEDEQTRGVARAGMADGAAPPPPPDAARRWRRQGVRAVLRRPLQVQDLNALFAQTLNPAYPSPPVETLWA